MIFANSLAVFTRDLSKLRGRINTERVCQKERKKRTQKKIVYNQE
jgi:hypothetical protein